MSFFHLDVPSCLSVCKKDFGRKPKAIMLAYVLAGTIFAYIARELRTEMLVIWILCFRNGL